MLVFSAKMTVHCAMTLNSNTLCVEITGRGFTSLGQKFHYTTHAWTLISAVIESASGKNFLDYMDENVFQPLGMTSTFPEVHTTLLYGRSR